ncbi:POC1 centriolar protein homolog A [Rhizoctonia solani]|uniref:POC1 centriolar protein homolog A n=1 Tax=Rhizoctonia solani TaxID=456999 RepID=A0A0K6FRU6_9AGAM|nr:POC1 centriolar protein homolog A [Rhizoctonia solani]
MIVHEGHTEAVCWVAFSPDGNSLVSGSSDDTIRTWSAHSRDSIGDPFGVSNGWITSVSYSPLGNIIASASADNTIRLWDVNTHQQLGQPIQCNSPIYSIAFSPSAKLIASGCDRNYNPGPCTIQLWDVDKRKAASSPFQGHTQLVLSVQFSPDRSRLVSGSYDKTLRVWDVECGTTIVGPLEGHTRAVRSIALSPDGSQIVSGSVDHTLRLWDTRSGEMIGSLFDGHTKAVNSVDFSPRGTYVVSGGEDNTVRLWDIRRGREVESFKEHTYEVRSVAFSPCGQYVASGSGDCKVIIRNILYDYLDSSGDHGRQIISSELSIRQIFDCLTESGCIDLSSRMDNGQASAMIVSGGGFGDIWKGQLHSGGKVAIKVWRTNTLEQCEYKTVKRAARELFLWSRMDHPNVHRLLGVIMFRGQYLGMVSEWMSNGNLHEYLRKQPSTDRYQLCVNVASGLEYMHRCKTIHGDLKAINVLVSADGTAKLSDFDFSIMSEVGGLVFSETSNSRLGSLRWAAPELLLADVPQRSTQCDVYALGMTFLEIFTGQVPYPDCKQDFTILLNVQKGTLPTRPLERLTDDEKNNMMWQLMLDCWNREPGQRPSSGQVVDADIPYSPRQSNSPTGQYFSPPQHPSPPIRYNTPELPVDDDLLRTPSPGPRRQARRPSSPEELPDIHPDDRREHRFDDLLPRQEFPDLDVDDDLLNLDGDEEPDDDDPFDDFGLPRGHEEPPGEGQQPFALPWENLPGNDPDDPDDPDAEPYEEVDPAEYCAAFQEHPDIRNAYVDVIVQKVLYGVNHRALNHQLKAAQRHLRSNPDIPADGLARMALTIRTVEQRLGLDSSDIITTYTLCPLCERSYHPDYINETDSDTCQNVNCNGVLYDTRILASGQRKRVSRRTFVSASVVGWLRRMLNYPGISELAHHWQTEDHQELVEPLSAEEWFAHLDMDRPLADFTDGLEWCSRAAGMDRVEDEETGEVEDRSLINPQIRLSSIPFGFSLTLSTDWFQPTREGNYSVGACYISLNNLPRHLRFLRENICLVLVMPGPKEPSDYALDQMLAPLIEELLELKQGINMNIRRGLNAPIYEDRVVYAELSQHIADLITRIKVGGGSGLKSELNFCLYCRARLSSLSVPAGYIREELPYRDPDEDLNNAYFWQSLESPQERKAFFDFTGNRFTALHWLPGWHTSTCSPPDAMHLFYLGQVLRFCVATGTLDKRTVTPNEIAFGMGLLEDMCVDYAKKNVPEPPNFHMMMHLQDAILKYGSLYNTHVWGMERANGILSAMSHNGRGGGILEGTLMRGWWGIANLQNLIQMFQSLRNRTRDDDAVLKDLLSALRGGPEHALQ